MEDFRVSARSRGSWAILKVSGDLDVYTAPRLREVIIDRIESGSRNIALDVSAVTFVDSTGLATMLGGLRRVREREGSFVLVKPPESIRRILHITELDKVLQIYSSVQELMKGKNDVKLDGAAHWRQTAT